MTPGGTIAMTSAPEGGMRPALGAYDLLAAVPQLEDVVAQVKTLEFRSAPGTSLSIDDMKELADTLRAMDAEGTLAVTTTGAVPPWASSAIRPSMPPASGRPTPAPRRSPPQAPVRWAPLSRDKCGPWPCPPHGYPSGRKQHGLSRLYSPPAPAAARP
ncbi:asparaginase domain-containing protein [Streptomyces netropsis]